MKENRLYELVQSQLRDRVSNGIRVKNVTACNSERARAKGRRIEQTGDMPSESPQIPLSKPIGQVDAHKNSKGILGKI